METPNCLQEILSRNVELLCDSDLADTLVELRQAWGDTLPALGDTCFDEIAENYGGEEYEDALNAFAQELTTKGYQLYQISDDDNHVFVYVKESETAAFEKLFKKEKRFFEKLRQHGRKFGMPARRNKTEGRVTGIKFPENDITVNIAFKSFAGDYAYGIRYGRDNEPCGGFVIDLSRGDRGTWEITESERYYMDVVYDPASRMFAARDYVRDCIVVGKDPLHPDGWKAIPSAPFWAMQRLHWFNGILFFGHDENIYMIKNEKCVPISSSESTYGSRGVDFVQIADGRIFASCYTRFYSVTKKLLGGYSVKPHSFEFMRGGFLCDGLSEGNKILYCQEEVEKGKLIALLIRLDVDNGQYSWAKLKHIEGRGNIKNFDDDFWYVDGRLDPLYKGQDMAQFICKETGEIYRIKAGALGKYRLPRVIRLSNGDIVFYIEATDSSRIFRPDDFWGYLKAMNPAPEKLEWINPEAVYPDRPKLE